MATKLHSQCELDTMLTSMYSGVMTTVVMVEADLEAERSSGSHWSAMNTKEPGCSGMAITKLGWEKKVKAFSKSEPPVQGLPRLFQSPSGSLGQT